MSLPFISVIIPCRNEEKFISDCLDSLIANSYPNDRIEILVIDGESGDNTRNIVQGYRDKFNSIKLIDNQRKTFPSAVNIGIKSSTGNPVLIVGSHAVYDPNYLSKCIDYSTTTGADNIGGILITKPQNDTVVGNLIVHALTNRFGVGNSAFRTGSDEIIEADTVFGGCYKRDVFDRIGYFNENLVSTSDYEFNSRLRRSGGRILLIPGIKADYYTRSSLKQFIKNNFRNGFWSIYPIAFLDYIPVSFRHMIPMFFVLSLAIFSILALIFPVFWNALLIIMILYLIGAFSFSFREKKISNFFLLPIFFFLLHITYGFGSVLALIKIPFVKFSR